MLILLTESFPVASSSFACFALSSNALPSFNRASSVGFSPSARRRRELEVHVKIMFSLISLSMSLAELAGFRELAKSGVITVSLTVQLFILFLFCLSKIVHFVGSIDLWRKYSCSCHDRCLLRCLVMSNISSTSGAA